MEHKNNNYELFCQNSYSAVDITRYNKYFTSFLTWFSGLSKFQLAPRLLDVGNLIAACKVACGCRGSCLILQSFCGKRSDTTWDTRSTPNMAYMAYREPDLQKGSQQYAWPVARDSLPTARVKPEPEMPRLGPR